MKNAIYKFFSRLAADERGLTAVEYAVLGGIVVTAIGLAGASFSTELQSAFADLIPGT